MSVTSPPRPPRPSRPVDREELEALVEALIEEARRRARRRRRRSSAAALLVVAAGVAVFIGFGGGGGGAEITAAGRPPGGQNPGASARSDPPLGALPAKDVWTAAFAFDPRNPGSVYAAALSADGPNTKGHVFKTTDGGGHWRPTATTGAGWTRADTLVADPHHPGTLYAGNVVAVYKTVDGGRSWQAFNKGLFSPQHRICYPPDPPGATRSYCVTLPFGTPGTTSWNRGEGWTTALAVDPADSRIVYSGADAVRKSTDGGHSWKTVFAPRGNGGVPALAIAPTRPEAIYAITNASNGRTSDTSIYKSTDAGKTWHASAGSVFTNPDWGAALAVDPQHPTTVYAAIGSTLVRTTDAGESWEPIRDGLPQGVFTALAVDPEHSGTVYAGQYTVRTTGAVYKATSTSGIYMTTNGGNTWTRVVSGVAISALAVDPARPTTIYAAGSTGSASSQILRSTDGGRTWATAG